MAGIDEIIKKQKEHLTKAQIRALAKAAERYKQYGSANRAEAYGSLHKGLSSTRRNLQNMGLASRQGKLISGMESAARATAERTYSGYNQQLNKVSDAYTRQAAARMARENQIKEYLEDLKKQQEEINAQIEQYKKEAAQAAAARQAAAEAQAAAARQANQNRQTYANAKNGLWNTPMTDTGTGGAPRKQPTQYEQLIAYAMQNGANKADSVAFATQYEQMQKAYELAKLNASTVQNWRQTMTGKEWDQDQDLQRFLYKQVQSAERTIEQNSAKWDAAINGEYSPRDSVGKGNKRKAIQEKEAALSKRNRAVAAMQNPQYAQYIMMPDDQFAVSYDAVKQQAERMRQQAWILRKDQAESMDDLSSEAARLEREAMELLAPWDQANALREGTGGNPSLASTVAVADADKIKDLPYDESKTPVLDYVQFNQNRWNPVKWASNTNFDGQNWRAAIENNWSAEDYDKTHDTKGSKFAALIFEWSYINGRTAFLYNQEFKSTYNVLNFGDLFSKDVSRDDAYRTFRYRCMMAFYDDDYESTRSKEKLEQMDAMLTLANLMTDEERARFTGMLETYGAKYADEYFEYLYNKVLPNRFQQYLSDYMGWQTSNPMDRLVLSIGSIPTNLIQGVTQPIQTLFTKQTDPVAARLSAAKANRAQSMRGAVGQHYGKWGRFFYDTTMSMADSATVAAISGGLGKLFVGMGIPASMAGKAGSVLGGSILGGSAFNSAYQEALDRGLSPDMARVTAFGQGVSEMLFESLSLDLLIDQFKKGGILKVSEKAWKNLIINTLVQGGVEGSEEVFTDLANRLWDNKVNGVLSEEMQQIFAYMQNGMSYDEAKKAVSKEFAEQLGMSFLGGFVSGGVMGGAAGAMHNIQMRGFERYGARMDADAKAEVRGFNFKDEQMQELAKQSKLTNQDYGVLAVARDQQLQQNALDYNAKLLKEGKITADVKKLFDRFIENPGLVENQDGGLTDFNGKEVFTAEEVAQMAKYDKYLQNAVDIRGNQDALIQQREEQAQALAEQQKRLDNPLITNEERAQRIGQEFGTEQKGVREQIAGDMAFQRGASDAAASSPSVNKSVIEGMKLKDAVTVKGNKVDTKKGNVTFDYGSNKTTDTMTNDQLIALRYAQGMADITGSNIKVESEFVGKDKNADGFYNPDTDTVHINLKGKNSMVYTLAHELTHRIAKLNKAAYTDLLKAVKEELSRSDLNGDALPEVYQEAIGKYMDGETSLLDALRKYEKEHYARNGIILDKDGGTKEVDEEIVCKCCETFLADPRFVQNMVTKHKTGAKAVYSFLKDVYNDMKALFGLAERNADEEAKGNAANISAESDILAQFGNIDRIFKLWSRAVKQMQKQTASVIVTKNATVTTDVATAIEDNGVVVDNHGEPVLKVHDHGDGGVQYSYSTWKKEGRDTLKAFMKKDTENYAKKRRKELRESGKSKAEVKAIVDSEVADMRTQYERIMKQMDKIYEISEKYLDKYASFGAWSRADVTVDKDGKPVFSVIRANGEYPMNIDFSLVCVKRRALDAVLNEIVRRGFMEKLVLDGESLVKVNDIIRQRGFEVACMGCFVEAKRFRQQGVAEGFAEKYNEIVKSLGGEAAYANFGQDETVKQSEGITGKKDSELNWSRVNELIEQYNKKKAANSRAGMTVEEAIAFELKENPKSRVLLKSGDFMSTRGMDRVAEVAPSILTLYNKQKGTGGPKAVFGDMQYLNDVCKKQWNVNKAYAVGGVRVQSFSDFVPRMFFDYCQMIADLATRKLPAHAYTKEESFVRLYGLTGMKINMSLFPKVGNDGLSAGLQYMRDKNGDIVYKDGKPVKTYAWAGESFNYDVAKEIQADAAYGKNCGTIAVGISDEQIRMMMEDPTIRMIIPYHKSSLNPVIAEMMGIQGFTDYTEYQRTKLDGKAIDVDFAFNQRLHEVGDPQAVVKEYLDWCKENGYTAKFEQFAYNADGSINENYYKLLEDFTLYDEQGNYCPQEAVQMVYPENMDALLDKYLKQDSDMQEARDAMIPAVADEIIRAMDRKASMSNTDFKTDKLGGKEYLKYLQLGAKVVNQTATEEEIKEFKQRMVQLSEDNRMAFLDKLREKLIRADEAAKVREVRDRQIARLKEEFKESREKARERRIRSDLTATLKKGNDRIVQLLSKPTENAHVPVQLAQSVAEYAQRLNQLLTTSEPKTGEFAGMEKQTKKGALNAQKILDAYNRSFADEETIRQAQAEDPSFNPKGLIVAQRDEKGNPIKDQTLIKMITEMDSIIQGKLLSDLTSDELRFVLNTMRGVIHTVTNANKLTGELAKYDAWDAGNTMINEMDSARRIKGLVRFYLEESLDLRRLAKLFSDSDESAVFVKLAEDLNRGAIEKERIAQALQGMFDDVSKHYGKEIRKWYGKNAEWIDTGYGFKITRGMRVSLALHVLNEGNMKHIKNGGLTIPDAKLYGKGKLKEAYANKEGRQIVRLNEEQINEILSHMTEAEKAYLAVAKEFFHKRTGYYVNKTSLQILGYSIANLKNYFPIHSNDNFTKTDFASIMQNGSVEGQSFLKERVEGTNPIYLEDITSVINRQIRGVSLYAGMAAPMRNFNAIMNGEQWSSHNEMDENGQPQSVWRRDTSVKETMVDRMGENGYKVVQQFALDASEMNHVDVTAFDRVINRIQKNYVQAVLMGNMKVALKQLASIPTAAYVIPWKYLALAMNPKEFRVDVDVMHEYAPLYGVRETGRGTEIANLAREEGIEMKYPKIFGWMTMMDTWAVRRLWKAAEYMVRDQQPNLPVGSDEYYKAVNEVWEKAIQQTQPNFSPLQRSDALRLSRGKYSALARPLVLFGTQRMQNGGIMIEATMDLINSKGKSKAEQKEARMKFGRAISSQIVQNIMLILVSAGVDLLRGRMKGWQDDDDEITKESVTRNVLDQFLSNAFGSFLGGSELYGSIVQKWVANSVYDTEFSVPALDAIQTIVQFVDNKIPNMTKYLLSGDYSDEEKLKKVKTFSMQLAKVIGYGTGIPVENLVKDILQGAIPRAKDHIAWRKTGELIPYLHQSGRLDSAKTAANYKEWTNLGKKGSTYLYWESKYNEIKGDKEQPNADTFASKLMADRDLSPEEKAMLFRMLAGDLENDGAVVYHPITVNKKLKDKEHGSVAYDFTNIDRYGMSQLGDAKYNGFMNAVEMGVPEDIAATAYRNYTSAKRYEKRRGVNAEDSFHDWLFTIVSDPHHRAILDMQVIGKAKSVDGSVSYKANGEVYADYSSRELFDAYFKGKKVEKTEAVANLDDTPEAKAQAFASMYEGYTAKNGIVYNDKGVVQADFTSDEAYRASQLGESHYKKYTDAVGNGLSMENAIKVVEAHKELTSDDDKDNSGQYAAWIFKSLKNPKDRAIAGAIYSTKPVTIKDGRTYDENGYIYRDYTSAAWYKLSNRTLSKDGVNKRYEAAKLLEKDGYTAEKTVAAYVELDKLSKKSEWQKWLKDNGYTNDQIKIILWSRGWAKLK